MAATEELRNDMLWRREAPESLPARSLHFADQGGIAWDSRLHALRDKALSMVPEAVCTVYADAAGPSGWGSALGDQCSQGAWSKLALWEGISGREPWALKEALCQWSSNAKGKLVFVRTGDAAAVAYANHGAPAL